MIETKTLANYFEGPASKIWMDPKLRGVVGRFEGLEGDELQRFADRLEEHGQNEPVLVWALPEDHPKRADGYELSLLAGANRLLAFNLKNSQRVAEGKPEIPIKYSLRTDIQSDEDAALLTIRENKDRQENGFIDHALNIAYLADEKGWSGKRIAEEYGITEGSVSQHKSVIQRIPREFWHYINTGEIKVKSAIDATMLEPELRQKALEACVKAIERAKETGEKITSEVQRRIIVDTANRAAPAVAPATPQAACNTAPSAKLDDPLNIDKGEDGDTDLTSPTTHTPSAVSSGVRPQNMTRQRSLTEFRQELEAMLSTVDGKPDLSDPMTKTFWTMGEYLAGRAEWSVVRNVALESFLDAYEVQKSEPKPEAPKGKGKKAVPKAKAA